MNGGKIYGNGFNSGVTVGLGYSDSGSATFTMNDGEIYDNTGHGVYVNGSTTSFTMSGGKIYDNTGGGVYVSDGIFTMSGGEIYGHTVTRTDYNYARGGGVYVQDGTFTMSGMAKIYNNTVTRTDNDGDGGGVYMSSNTTFTMSGGEIYGNTVTGTGWGGGGGVYMSNGVTFTMSGTAKIYNNTATGYGGGVCVQNGTFTMSGGEIYGNTATSGGGVYVYGYSSNSITTFTMGGTAKIYNNTVTGSGGGVCMSEGTTFTMDGGEIYGNTGCGVYVAEGYNESTTFTMSGGKISGNTDRGVYVGRVATFTMTGGEISGHTITSTDGGGGVYVALRATFTMSGTAKIHDNTVTVTDYDGGGGGVYVRDGTFTMNGGEIYDNTVIGDCGAYGGGVYVLFGYIDNSATTFTMVGDGTTYGTPKIYGNTVTVTGDDGYYYARGGGVYVSAISGSNVTFTMDGGEIYRNTVNGSNYGDIYGIGNGGGGVYVSAPISGSNVTFTAGGKIYSNTVIGGQSSYGGGVYMSGNTTFTGGADGSNVVKIKDSSGETTIAEGHGHAAYAGVPGNYRRKESTVYNMSLKCIGGTSPSDWELVGYGWGEADLVERLEALRNTAENNGTYTLRVEANERIVPHQLYFDDKIVNIILTGIDNPLISLRDLSASDPTGSIFTIGNGVRLTLNNIILNGFNYSRDNTAPLVRVNGTLTMNAGSMIHGNINVSGSGGGVYVVGTFIMNGGEIYNNTASYYNGGGGSGGGVYVTTSGTFTMTGGVIYNNDAYLPSSPSAADGGGGVYVAGTFTKTGGTITGWNSDEDNIVRNNNGITPGVTAGRGHAVQAVNTTGTIIKHRENAAGPDVTLSFNGTTGAFSGGWEY